MYMLQKINNKTNNVIFHIDKYNTKNEVVKKALSNHVSDTNVHEMICKSCHNGLHKPVPTMSKHAIYMEILQHYANIFCVNVK